MSLKLLKEEYARLVPEGRSSGSDAHAAVELAAVRKRLSEMFTEARALLTPEALHSVLDCGSESSSEFNTSTAAREAMALCAARCLALLEALEATTGPPSTEITAAAALLEKAICQWRQHIAVGDSIDVLWESVWYRCKVVGIDNGKLKVRYHQQNQKQ